MMMFVAINVVAKEQSCKQGYDNLPFHEIILEDDGEYDIDLDFDGTDEKIIADENSNIVVLRKDMSGKYLDVSAVIPYSIIRIHSCCDVHRAYTAINHLQHTIYSESHYGCSEMSIRQFQKVGERWQEVIPVTPSSIINKDLYLPRHLFMEYFGSIRHWYWGNGKGGLHYLLR